MEAKQGDQNGKNPKCKGKFYGKSPENDVKNDEISNFTYRVLITNKSWSYG